MSDLHENEHVGGTHVHMESFAWRLVLTQTKGNSEMANYQSSEHWELECYVNTTEM